MYYIALKKKLLPIINIIIIIIVVVIICTHYCTNIQVVLLCLTTEIAVIDIYDKY